MTGYGLDPAALDKAKRGIQGTFDDLKAAGTGAPRADVGHGFGNAAPDADDVGHAGLAAAGEKFFDAWSTGVRNMVQAGDEFAHGLGLSAGAYNDAETYNSKTLNTTMTNTFGETLTKKVGDAL